MEWKADQLPDSRHDNRDRCFTARLGGYVGRNLDRRAMDGGREEVPYQLVGATRWCIRSKDVRQGQKQHPHTFEDGQYYCSSVHKPPGRNEVPSLGSLSMSSLAVVPAQRDHTLSRASTRDIQQYSGQRIPHLPFISRVETAHHSLQSDLSTIGPMQGGPLASRLNNQLDQYVSWRPDPYAIATDAFQIAWHSTHGYAFPPFSLVGKCLQKIHREEATVVMVAPVWSTQPWYPMLLESLIDIPILLTMHPDMLSNPFNERHPLMVHNKLQLAAWKLSGSNTELREFQRKLQSSLSRGGAKGPMWPTSQHGTNGVAGVVNNKLIPFHARSISLSTF